MLTVLKQQGLISEKKNEFFHTGHTSRSIRPCVCMVGQLNGILTEHLMCLPRLGTSEHFGYILRRKLQNFS